MYGPKRYLLNTSFGNKPSPNRRSSSVDEWAMTADWGNDGGGWFPGTYSLTAGVFINSDEFITKNNEIEQNILP